MSGGDLPGGTDNRRIYFLTDVEESGVGWTCQRCGYAAPTKEQQYEHRKGFVSRCFRSRILQKFIDWYTTNTDQEGDDV